MTSDRYKHILAKIQSNNFAEVIADLEKTDGYDKELGKNEKTELLARAYLLAKDYQKSYDNFMILVNQSYGFDRNLVDEFAKAAMYLRKTKAAVSIYQALHKQNPYDKSLLENIIRIGISARESDTVLKYTSLAIAENNVSPDLIKYAIDHLQARSDHKILLSFLSLVAIHLPNKAALWRNIAIIYFKAGNFKKSLEICDIAKNKSKGSDFLEIEKLEGNINLESRNLAGAKKIFLGLYQKSDKPDHYLTQQLCLTFYYLREYQSVIEVVSKIDDEMLLDKFNFLQIVLRTYHRLNMHQEIEDLLALYSKSKPLTDRGHQIKYFQLLLSIDREEELIRMIDALNLDLLSLNDDEITIYISALMNIGRFDKVIEILSDEKNIKAKKVFTNFRSRLQLCFAYLNKKDFTKGFELYESRKEMTNLSKFIISRKGQEWDGTEIPNKTLLITAEQGQGDVIMLARYLTKLPKLAKVVICEVQSALLELFRYNFPTINFVKRGSSLPRFDYYIQAMSLFKVLNLDSSNIPYKSGYIKCQNKHANISSTKYKVAISWQGSRLHPNDYLRSIPVTSLESLYQLSDQVQFYSIQLEDAEHELRSCEFAKSTIYLGKQIKSFADTAAIANSVDLLITCDSANGHLFGAMNKRASILLHRPNDWRWQAEGSSSYWYDSVKLHRIGKNGNTNQGWNDIVSEVKNDINSELLRLKK